MSTWYRREERGVVMAWWATCYALGGAIATIFATYVSTHETFFPELGWRRGFFGPAAILAVISVAFILLTRNRPSDVGLEDIAEDTSQGDGPESAQDGESMASVCVTVLRSPSLWITGSMYFFLTLSRYVFLMWLPRYLVVALDFGT